MVPKGTFSSSDWKGPLKPNTALLESVRRLQWELSKTLSVLVFALLAVMMMLISRIELKIIEERVSSLYCYLVSLDRMFVSRLF